MSKLSAGILVYRQQNNQTEVLLGHPGGPFYAKKDDGVWSIPKGEYEDEEPLDAAKREFQEELGQAAPTGNYQDLGEIKQSGGKVNHIWAVTGDLDVSKTTSNTFELEWPPKSGKTQSFPEIDRAEWFNLAAAKRKIRPYQLEFIERLEKLLGFNPTDTKPLSLF